MTPGETEKTKLVAGALDRASTACFTVGVATPLAGYVYNIGGIRTAVALSGLMLGLGGWMLAAIALHYVARRNLRGLDA